MKPLRFILLLLAGLVQTACRRPAPPPTPPITIRWPVMNTIAELSLPASQATNQATLQPLVAEAFSSVEDTLSLFQPESDLAAINRSDTTNTPIAIGSMTADVLAYALKIAKESHGAFDPTASPLLPLWGLRGIQKEHLAPPAATDIRTTLQSVGWQHLKLTRNLSTPQVAVLQMTRPKMQLDLGGIAKGYAVDLAYQRLRQQGASDFLINLAGNMRAQGRPEAKRTAWRVGIRNPFTNNSWLGTILLADGEGIATSGSYERYVVINGQRYGHILDPRTGHPVAGMVSVTVIATSAMEADALSTALFVLGPERCHPLLQAHPGCEAIFLPDTEPRRLQITDGLKSRFQPAPAWKDAVTWL